MTVSTINVTSGPYAGNDIADTFNYTFLAIDKTNLSVYETDDMGTEVLLTLDLDYVVNSFGDDGGGTITRSAGPLPTGYTWFIRSNYKKTQLTAFTSQGAFFPDLHESAVDKLTLLLQQISDSQDRSPEMNPGYFGSLPITIDNPIDGHVLRWSSSLTNLENYDPLGRVFSYDTLADALADLAISEVPACNLKERVAGEGGSAVWDVVPVGTVTPNGIDIVASTGDPAYALVHRAPYSSASLGLTATPAVIDLRSVVAKDGDTASIAIDGFSYDYVFDSQSSQSDNGVTCLQAGAAPGRWKQTSTVLVDSFAISVGAGGDFATINDAIVHCVQYRPREQDTCTLTLLTGFVMAEQVLTESVDLGWITIVAVDPPVMVTRSSMTTLFHERYPLFGAHSSGKTPTIVCDFEYDQTGVSTDVVFIYCDNGGAAVWGNGVDVWEVTNAPYGLVARGAGSQISADSGRVNSAEFEGIRASEGATVVFTYGILDGSGDYNMHVSEGAVVLASNSNITGVTIANVKAESGATVVLDEAFLINGQFNHPQYGIYAEAANVSALGVTAENFSLAAVYASRTARVALSGLVKTEAVITVSRFGAVVEAAAIVLTPFPLGDWYQVERGGVIAATDNTAVTNVTPNTVTPSGIIYLPA